MMFFDIFGYFGVFWGGFFGGLGFLGVFFLESSTERIFFIFLFLFFFCFLVFWMFLIRCFLIFYYDVFLMF